MVNRVTESDITRIADIARERGDFRTTLAVIRTIESEKRTHLAQLRAGIGILTIPMSLLTILIATSEFYMINQVLSFITGLVFGIIALAVIGGYLVVSSLIKLRRSDRLRHDACDETEELLKENGILHE